MHHLNKNFLFEKSDQAPLMNNFFSLNTGKYINILNIINSLALKLTSFDHNLWWHLSIKSLNENMCRENQLTKSFQCDKSVQAQFWAQCSIQVFRWEWWSASNKIWKVHSKLWISILQTSIEIKYSFALHFFFWQFVYSWLLKVTLPYQGKTQYLQI